MGEYKGPERRKTLDDEMYQLVCRDRFTDINEKLVILEKDTKYLRTKIDNGLSTLPKKMNWLMGLFVTVMIGVGSLIWISAYNEAKLSTEIQVYLEQTNEDNISETN